MSEETDSELNFGIPSSTGRLLVRTSPLVAGGAGRGKESTGRCSFSGIGEVGGRSNYESNEIGWLWMSTTVFWVFYKDFKKFIYFYLILAALGLRCGVRASH